MTKRLGPLVKRKISLEWCGLALVKSVISFTNDPHFEVLSMDLQPEKFEKLMETIYFCHYSHCLSQEVEPIRSQSSLQGADILNTARNNGSYDMHYCGLLL